MWPPPHTPPDAGSSYLGVYGLANLWVAWILSREPSLLGLTPTELQREARRQAEPCPACAAPMRLRLAAPPKRDRRRRGKAKAEARRRAGGRVWKCYHHDPTIVVAIEPMQFERAPKVDVLGKIAQGTILDYVYASAPGGKAAWTVVEKEKL